MKIFLSLLLAAAMLVSFAACSQTNEPAASDNTAAAETAETTAEETTVDEYANNLPDVDLKGFEYRILSYGADIKSIYIDELNGEAVNDAVFSKITTIEDKYNCDITLCGLSDPSEHKAADAIKTYIMAGDDSFDIIQTHDITMGNLSLEGYYLNLLEMPYFEFDKPWWPAQTLDSLTVNNQMYLMSNNISYFNLGETRVLYFNKTMIDDYGLELPYNYVYDGTWTLDKMASMISGTYRDLNGNSKADAHDSFGMVNASWYCWLEPFQVETYVEGSDGVLSYSFPLEKITALVEKFNSLLFAGDGWLCTSEDTSTQLFSNEQGLFYYETLRTAVNILSKTELIYGILPMPKFDENQKGYCGGCTDRPVAIPITVADDRVDTIALITEALNIEGYKQVFPAYYEQALKSRYADSSDDAAMIDIIHENVIMAFTYIYGNYNSAYYTLMKSCFLSNTKQILDVASWAAKQEKTQIKWVDKLNNFFQG